jgi:hypothetical protein
MQEELLDAIAEYREQIKQLHQLTNSGGNDDQEALQVRKSRWNPSCNITRLMK